MSSKDAFIVPAIATDDDRKPVEDLDELRKIKNGIAKKLREAKVAKFMDAHPNIKKLKESLPVAQPGAIPRDKEPVKEVAKPEPVKEVAKPEPVKVAVSKPVNVPKAREIPAYTPHSAIQAIVSNPSGRWF